MNSKLNEGLKNMDDYEKLSDKLIFSLLSGDNFDDEALQEMNDLYSQKEEEEKKPSENDISWTVAPEKASMLELAQGEYPPLFRGKNREDDDVFSKNVFSLEASFFGGPVYFVPRPSELLIGDLSRAAHDTKGSAALDKADQGASTKSVDVLLEPEALKTNKAARKPSEGFGSNPQTSKLISVEKPKTTTSALVTKGQKTQSRKGFVEKLTIFARRVWLGVEEEVNETKEKK